RDPSIAGPFSLLARMRDVLPHAPPASPHSAMALPHRDDYDRGAEAAAVGSSGPDLLRRHWHHSSPPRAGRNENAEEIVQIRRNMPPGLQDRKSTRLNSSHVKISYAVFCLKKKNE